MGNLERVRALARRYYTKQDVQACLVQQALNKEVVPCYFEGFGKRPDIIEYEQDIANLATKGATSFHCSEELWSSPLELSTALSAKQFDKLRLGWDLILDIDCKFLEYSKIAAWLVCEALYFHGIHNFGLKFSGGSGWHIGLAFKAFPSTLNRIPIKDFFPEGPRLIAAYLKDMIKNGLASRIMELSTPKEIARALSKPAESLLDKEKAFNPFKILEIDTVLIAPRHLYRMAYSLHEGTGLASVVIRPGQLKAFHPGWAKADRVFPKPFMPEPEPNEALELLTQALDWQAKKEEKVKKEKEIKAKEAKQVQQVERAASASKAVSIQIAHLGEELFPPCIKTILQGMPHDGRKRALFILINFFRSLGLSFEELEKKLASWNKLNYKPLRENYIATQLQWFKRQEPRLPPNCNLEAYYQDIGVCAPDFFCKAIKNPVNYVARKARIEEKEKKGKSRRKKKK